MRQFALTVLAFVVVTTAAIAIALLVTPMQSVSAVGQTVKVGASAPTTSLSGPGELELFGQQFDTTIQFTGPVRPKLALSEITLAPELADMVSSGNAETSAAELQDALVSGWVRYFAWQISVVALASAVLLGGIAGWRHMSWRGTTAFIVGGVLLAEAVNIGAIMTTAYTAPERLRQVDSLQALVGVASGATLPTAVPVASTQAGRVVVMGDSTAAGLGNSPVPGGTDLDRACGRSADSFAVALDRATDWEVTNLACSGATIPAGLLGEQRVHDVTVEPQLSALRAIGPQAVVMSIGANDANWSNVIRMCALVPDCGNAAVDAFFRQQLANFTRDYLVLLMALRSVSGIDHVVINTYYDPFEGGVDCVKQVGITVDKRRILVGWLREMNSVIENGAKAASYSIARPDFSGHGMCSDQPYVQGIADSAPFHPNAAGALAIALADQQALRSATT